MATSNLQYTLKKTDTIIRFLQSVVITRNATVNSTSLLIIKHEECRVNTRLSLFVCYKKK